MQNHFARFGLQVRYAIDLEALERAFTQQSFALHPDFLANAAEAERQRAQHASADLNTAYRTLRSEPERAQYLLGLLVREAQATGRLAPGAQLDAEALPKDFLQEMFVLQEEVEAATGEAAAALRAQVEARHRGTLAGRARLFEEAAQAADSERLQALQSNLNQEKYLLRLLERLPSL